MNFLATSIFCFSFLDKWNCSWVDIQGFLFVPKQIFQAVWAVTQRRQPWHTSPSTCAKGPSLHCHHRLCQQPSGPKGEHPMDECMTCLKATGSWIGPGHLQCDNPEVQVTQSHCRGTSPIPVLSVSGRLSGPLCGLAVEQACLESTPSL